MKGLKVAEGITLPADAPVHRLAFIGTTNSGKSYGAMKVAEQMTLAGMQWVAMDPMGIWYGMRLAADGKGDGLDIVIFGGVHGDVPIRDVDGAMVADAIISQGISAIIDTSQFEHDAERSRFAHRFAERFYWLKKSSPSAIHLFLEEAHEYVPQVVQQGEADMVHVFNRVWKQGGNYGIGGSLITQRPQDVAKKALGLSAAVFAFNTTGSNEYEAVAKWLKGVAGIADLHTFKPGTCLLWSPPWLRVSRTIQISARQTYHARFDPMAPNAPQPEVRTLDASAIAALREAFQASVEEHDANDPKKLRARIEELEAELEAAEPGPCMNCAELQEEIRLHEEARQRVLAALDTWPGSDAPALPTTRIEVVSVPGDPDAVPPAIKVKPVPPKLAGTITPLMQSLLDAMKLLYNMGQPDPEFVHVAAVAGKGANAGPVRKALSSLAESGLVERFGTCVRITPGGLATSEAEGFKTLAELHKFWLDSKKGLVRDILAVVLQAGQKPVTLDAIGSAIGKNINAGPVRSAITDVVNLGVAERVGKEAIRATSLLFPPALTRRK